VDPSGRGLAEGDSPAAEPEEPTGPEVSPAPPVQVAGRVVARSGPGAQGPPDDAPVEGFTVLALRQVALPEVVDPAVFEFESAGGRFELSGLPAGRYDLFVRAPGRALWRGEPVALADTAAGTAPLVEVEAVLAPGAELRGLVLDGVTGLPVAGAVVVSETDAPVQILSLTGEEYAQHGVLARAVSGPDGGFELRDLTPGQHVLRVSAPGHAPAWEHALADAAGAEVALELTPGGALEGRVTRPGGAPLEGGRVICSLTDFGASHPVMSYASAITDAEGRYELVDLPAGNWPLLSFGVEAEARGPMEPELAFVRIRAGERARHDFAAPAAGLRFEGTLLLPDGAPAAGRALWLTPLGGGRDMVSTNTDSEGRFALAGLEARAYAVYTSRGAPPDMALLGEVDLGDGRDVLEHTLQLAGGSLAGSVLHGDGGGGVRYAVVLLLQRDGSEDGVEFLAKTFTDAAGAFGFEHVPAGSYDLQVASTERGLGHAVSEGLTVATAQRLEVGELFLYPGGALEVVAVGPDGRPAVGARLRLVFEGRVVHLLESAELDVEGRARVPGLAAGAWELTLGGGRYRERTLAVDVARSDGFTRVEVELEAR
jgi:hypothetical protein